MLRALPLLLAAAAASLSAQTFEITGGPAPYQVIQRGADNRAGFKVEGLARQLAGRPVEARLLRGGLVVEGFDWRAAGTVAG